jgi:hypothetical protein
VPEVNKMALPKLKDALRDDRERLIWDTAYAAAYVNRELQPGPELDRHNCAKETAKLLADAAVVGYRELTGEKAGQAWNRGLALAVGEESGVPPIHTP